VGASGVQISDAGGIDIDPGHAMTGSGEGHCQWQSRKAKADDSHVRARAPQPFRKVRAFGWG
jgi:hypothetical protein